MRLASSAATLLLPALLAYGSADQGLPSARVAATTRPSSAPERILVFTRTRGWRHDSIPHAVATLRTLATEEGFAIEHSEEASQFDEANLRRFRAVVFANTTLDVLDAAQQDAFERFVRAGGGFMGIHSAADTEYDWPWYGELVGAWFDSHPPGLQSSRLRFEGGDGWTVTDELYNYRRNPRPFVDVIATIDEHDYVGGTMGQDHPIAWCHDRFGGRAWYTGLGHDPALYADLRFRAHLRRGLRYASGRSDDC